MIFSHPMMFFFSLKPNQVFFLCLNRRHLTSIHTTGNLFSVSVSNGVSSLTRPFRRLSTTSEHLNFYGRGESDHRLVSILLLRSHKRKNGTQYLHILTLKWNFQKSRSRENYIWSYPFSASLPRLRHL